MRRWMLGAFCTTGFTGRCTERGEMASMGGVASHEFRAQAAEVRAIAAQLDTRGHGFDVCFVQAAIHTAFAGGGAVLTGFEGGIVFFGLGGHERNGHEGRRQDFGGAGKDIHRVCVFGCCGLAMFWLPPGFERLPRPAHPARL